MSASTSALHPERAELLRFAAGTLGTEAHARCAAHVAECDPCFDVVAESLDDHLPGVAGGLAPAVHADSLGRVLRRREAGERVVLPVPASGGRVLTRPAASRRVRTILSIAAAMLLLVLGTVMVDSRELTARDMAGQLRLLPANPRPGDSVRVEYRGGRFEGETRLRLRGTYRRANDEEPEWVGDHVDVARLVKGADGTFRGAFLLPVNAVYGAFVVEDMGGQHLDARGGRVWDLLVREPDGRVAFDAMRQRIRYLGERDPERALETARELVSVHPERIESWRTSHFHEGQLARRAGTTAADADGRHTAQLAATHARLSAQLTVPAGTMDAMWLYASALGDTTVTAYWSRRLVREHPDSPEGVRHRMWALQGRLDGKVLDTALDRLWASVPESSREPVVSSAFMAARMARDTAALRRWGTRLLTIGTPHYHRSLVAFTYAGTPGLEGEGAELLRRHLEEFGRGADIHRPLGRSAAQYSVQVAELRGSVLTALGRSLLAMNRRAEALDTLELAASTWWSSGVHAAIASTKLALGDSLGAARAAAFATVEARSPADAAAIRSRFSWAHDSAWGDWLAEGRATLRRQLLASSVVRPLAVEVRIADTTGREHDLRELVKGRQAALAFFSRTCIGTLDQLPELRRAAAQLAGSGTRLIAITRERPSPELTAWLRSRMPGIEVYHDVRGEAATVLEPYGTPDHMVLDDAGRIRFDRLSARELPGRVAALR